MQQYHVLLGNGVLVNLYSILAVFLHVGFLQRVSRKLAWLAAHHESCIQFHRQGSPQDESSAFYAHHFGYPFVLIHFIQFVNHNAHALGILK